MTRFLLTCFLAITIPISATPETPQGIATEILAPLLDPVKVATLKGDRPAGITDSKKEFLAIREKHREDHRQGWFYRATG